MTEKEKEWLNKIEEQIDFVLNYYQEKREHPINAPLVESLFRCRQLLKDGGFSWKGTVEDPPESWQK